MEVEIQKSNRIKQSQRRVLALFGFGLAPFALALIFFYTPAVNWVKVHSEGQLLEQPLLVEAYTDLPARWELWYISESTCDKTCQTRLAGLENLQLALGKDRHRLRVRVMPAQDQWAFLQPGMLAIVDPRHYMILSYEKQQADKAILKDLQRLLKYARIG